MTMLTILLVLGITSLAAGQRPSFAGTKPIGYPELSKDPDQLADRFGEEDGTTQRLPIEANGDRDLVDRLSKLPIDKQPFWFINWQAAEANRKKPQTYPQRPNSFLDPIPGTGSTPQTFGSFNKVPGTLEKPAASQNELSNRFGDDDVKTNKVTKKPIKTSEEAWREAYLSEVDEKIQSEYTKL